MSCVWEEGEGELASENCMDKGMCITGLLDHLISKMQAKIKMGKLWLALTTLKNMWFPVIPVHK